MDRPYTVAHQDWQGGRYKQPDQQKLLVSRLALASYEKQVCSRGRLSPAACACQILICQDVRASWPAIAATTTTGSCGRSALAFAAQSQTFNAQNFDCGRTYPNADLLSSYIRAASATVDVEDLKQGSLIHAGNDTCSRTGACVKGRPTSRSVPSKDTR